jgi:hypothetical protein
MVMGTCTTKRWIVISMENSSEARAKTNSYKEMTLLLCIKRSSAIIWTYWPVNAETLIPTLKCLLLVFTYQLIAKH